MAGPSTLTGDLSSFPVLGVLRVFSPPDTVREVEEYQVELSDVTVLELIIVANNSGGTARASLKSLRLS